MKGYKGTESQWLQTLIGGGQSANNMIGPKGETSSFDRITEYSNLDTENKSILGAIDELVNLIETNTNKIIEELSNSDYKNEGLESISSIINELIELMKINLTQIGVSYNDDDDLNTLIDKIIVISENN